MTTTCPFRIDPASRQVSGTGLRQPRRPDDPRRCCSPHRANAPTCRSSAAACASSCSRRCPAPWPPALSCMVRQALSRWLAGVIDVGEVTVRSSDDPGGPLEPRHSAGDHLLHAARHPHRAADAGRRCHDARPLPRSRHAGCPATARRLRLQRTRRHLNGVDFARGGRAIPAQIERALHQPHPGPRDPGAGAGRRSR